MQVAMKEDFIIYPSSASGTDTEDGAKRSPTLGQSFAPQDLFLDDLPLVNDVETRDKNIPLYATLDLEVRPEASRGPASDAGPNPESETDSKTHLISDLEPDPELGPDADSDSDSDSDADSGSDLNSVTADDHAKLDAIKVPMAEEAKDPDEPLYHSDGHRHASLKMLLIPTLRWLLMGLFIVLFLLNLYLRYSFWRNISNHLEGLQQLKTQLNFTLSVLYLSPFSNLVNIDD